MKKKRIIVESSLGAALIKPRGVFFKVWAPKAQTVDVKIQKKKRFGIFPLKKDKQGYFSGRVSSAVKGDRYQYVLNKTLERPDPASRFQPLGVHGPSQVTDPDSFKWRDSAWKGVSLKDAIFYEFHVGTLTPEGTFEAAIKKIPYLKKLGVTCLEMMPVAQFPGKRNWGYDGVGLYAVQNSYGEPDQLKKFVNACHLSGIAVCLDVVYNHFGPEGNYLNDYGPYFTKKYNTPWGDAVNYDDHQSREVRHFVIENALYWIREFHFDALRLDAIHGIFDSSKTHLLKEMNDQVQKLGRSLKREVLIIAESDLNDSKIIRPKSQKGYGLCGQWSDDFHHAVHAILTGEKKGYYRDFGRFEDLFKAIQSGFVYDGNYSPFRKRKHGNRVSDLPREQLVVCTQNHDQVGNRAWGERLTALISHEKLKLAGALLLLSPNTPMLFMGQEYGELSPFQYFIDHGDRGLIKAVQAGRKREFEAFGWKSVPDPASKKTYANSKLKWGRIQQGRHRELLQLYTELIKLRKKIVALEPKTRERVQIRQNAKTRLIQLYYPSKFEAYDAFFSLSHKKQKIAIKGAEVVMNTAYSGHNVQGDFVSLEPFSAIVLRSRLSNAQSQMSRHGKKR